MKKSGMIFFVVIFSLIFSTTTIIAKNKGKGKEGEEPYGWSQGQKKGWESDTPPGLNKEKNTENKEKVKGKKTEPPKGVQKASEKGKGKKKGLFERWFGGSTEDK